MISHFFVIPYWVFYGMRNFIEKIVTLQNDMSLPPIYIMVPTKNQRGYRKSWAFLLKKNTTLSRRFLVNSRKASSHGFGGTWLKSIFSDRTEIPKAYHLNIVWDPRTIRPFVVSISCQEPDIIYSFSNRWYTLAWPPTSLSQKKILFEKFYKKRN